jgi:hypothetical protein
MEIQHRPTNPHRSKVDALGTAWLAGHGRVHSSRADLLLWRTRVHSRSLMPPSALMFLVPAQPIENNTAGTQFCHHLGAWMRFHQYPMRQEQRRHAASRHWNWHTSDQQISRLLHSQYRNAEHGAARPRRPFRRRSRASWPANVRARSHYRPGECHSWERPRSHRE